ncbi:MAG: hypothetical protein HEP71_02330 [Roseivirga sp.]|nr:hypothetical protein [Roseivirga sp.]
MRSVFYDRNQLPEVLQELEQKGHILDYNYEKHRFELTDENAASGASLRLPITMFYEKQVFVPEKSLVYVMVLVQSGSASIGVFEDEKCLEHKVFGSYMVRKKQGKSQIKHLKTKGKSRAGSRVRLASTIEFFENINTRLQGHFDQYQFDRIALSCSKILIPYLFNSKIPTPFDKRDERIYKIPKHLHQPNYEVMLGMQRYLNKAELVFDEERNPELNTMD